MPYRIEDNGDLVEVALSGKTTKWELLELVGKLRERDPLKERSDLWTVADETVIPAHWYWPLIDAIGKLCCPELVGKPSAVVAANRLQHAQFEMYRVAAGELPWDMGVFLARDEALEWLGCSG